MKKFFRSICGHYQWLKEKQQVKSWLDTMGIKGYTIEPDLSVDVRGNVDLSHKNLDVIPVQFNRVSGFYRCYNNSLTTLQGSPRAVGGYFDCGHNMLGSLAGMPQSIGSDVWCQNNQLTSLEGVCPSIKGNFNCSNNRLASLRLGPERVTGNYVCDRNLLINLHDLPHTVGGVFTCHQNEKLGFMQDILDFSEIKKIMKNHSLSTSIEKEALLPKDSARRHAKPDQQDFKDTLNPQDMQDMPDTLGNQANVDHLERFNGLVGGACLSLEVDVYQNTQLPKHKIKC